MQTSRVKETVVCGSVNEALDLVRLITRPAFGTAWMKGC